MKLIILDRDGVINYDSDDYIKSPEEWIPIPGSLEAIARLNHAGYHVVVASNQSGIGRGYYNLETLNQINQKMHKRLTEVGGLIDAIFFCPHTPEDHCQCRKPAIGMFLQIAERMRCKLKHVPFVGDTLTDVTAARVAALSPILVRTGKGERTLEKSQAATADVPVYDSLEAYVTNLLSPDNMSKEN